MEIDFEQFILNHKTGYEIVKLRHQSGKTFKELACYYGLSIEQVQQKYHTFLRLLFKLYFKYLYTHNLNLKHEISDIINFYESMALSVAYLEKTYKNDLALLSHNKAPIILGNYTDVPPYRKLTSQEITELEKKILDSREHQKMTFIAIGKQYALSKEKVRDIYTYYYHKKVLEAIKRIDPTVDFSFKTFIVDYSNSACKRWKYIENIYADLIPDLID